MSSNWTKIHVWGGKWRMLDCSKNRFPLFAFLAIFLSPDGCRYCFRLNWGFSHSVVKHSESCTTFSSCLITIRFFPRCFGCLLLASSFHQKCKRTLILWTTVRCLSFLLCAWSLCITWAPSLSSVICRLEQFLTSHQRCQKCKASPSALFACSGSGTEAAFPWSSWKLKQMMKNLFHRHYSGTLRDTLQRIVRSECKSHNRQ